MGYGSYTVTRNGERIEAGYLVDAECDKEGCDEAIDRGLAYLCGQTPGGDEYGCGFYFCGHHMTVDQLCEACSAKATEANTWTHPGTGWTYDLRNLYLPPGEPYRPDGWVWKHLGDYHDGVPVLVPVKQPGLEPGGHLGCVITEYDFRVAGSVAWGQQLADRAGNSRG
ncbi:hypothetical protein [Streptomyces sp. NPDC046925]|uniref:hypothetical protein n=1 Tax=Streptomyces sp. NPDC046925 TaxID=3155375 RepID=UPI0033E76EA7